MDKDGQSEGARYVGGEETETERHGERGEGEERKTRQRDWQTDRRTLKDEKRVRAAHAHTHTRTRANTSLGGYSARSKQGSNPCEPASVRSTGARTRARAHAKKGGTDRDRGTKRDVPAFQELRLQHMRPVSSGSRCQLVRKSLQESEAKCMLESVCACVGVLTHARTHAHAHTHKPTPPAHTDAPTRAPTPTHSHTPTHLPLVHIVKALLASVEEFERN